MALLSRGFLRRCARRAVFVLLAAAVPAQAQHRQRGENAIKAAYLYNFTKFVEWPPAALSPSPAAFAVCVFADEGFRRELEAVLQGERVDGKPVVTHVPASPDDLRRCQVLYFGVHESERAARLLPALRQAAVLTVGEGSGFLALGGHISFVLEADRVRFDINRRDATAAGLMVSSKLLRVARQVHPPDQP